MGICIWLNEKKNVGTNTSICSSESCPSLTKLLGGSQSCSEGNLYEYYPPAPRGSYLVEEHCTDEVLGEISETPYPGNPTTTNIPEEGERKTDGSYSYPLKTPV